MGVLCKELLECYSDNIRPTVAIRPYMEVTKEVFQIKFVPCYSVKFDAPSLPTEDMCLTFTESVWHKTSPSAAVASPNSPPNGGASPSSTVVTIVTTLCRPIPVRIVNGNGSRRKTLLIIAVVIFTTRAGGHHSGAVIVKVGGHGWPRGARMK